MKKLVGISIAAAGIGLATAGIYALLNCLDSNRKLSQLLIDLRDDLELDCDLINSTLSELPAEPTTDAERAFAQAINAAADFATTAINIYAYLSDEDINSFSAQTKNAYIECIRAFIQNAERHIILIDELRSRLEGNAPKVETEDA